MGVMPSQEAESLLRRRQRAVERIEQRRLAEGIDLAGLHHDPLAVVAGWAPRKIERLMEAAGGTIDAMVAPVGQGAAEQPVVKAVGDHRRATGGGPGSHRSPSGRRS